MAILFLSVWGQRKW